MQLMALDYCEKPVLLMQPDRPVTVPIWADYERIVAQQESRGAKTIEALERFSYYEMAEKTACIVQTGETAVYANIAPHKGVIE